MFFLILTSIQLQTKNKVLISRIEVEGNTKTKDFIINREIRHPVNGLIDSAKINQDINRLENLGLFSGVSWTIKSLEDSTIILKYIVKESIQKTPPTVFPTYNENKGWSLNALWLLNNFRGRNQLLTISGSIGGEDTYGISFNDPWIFNNHISFSLNISRNLFKHRFLNRDIDLNRFKIGFGKWFGDNIKTVIAIALESKEFSNKKEYDLFKYIDIHSMLKYDTRDIYWNPGKGILFNNSIQYIEGYKIENLIWDQSYSFYFSLNRFKKKTIIAFNGSLKQKLGYRNQFWQNYIGSSNTIRGWPIPDYKTYDNESYRFGHEYLHASIEYRYEIIPKYITTYGIESGLVIVLFADFGYMLNHWPDKLIMNGTGIGVRIPFPLVGVLRLDFGVGAIKNKWNSGSFHFGIGQKF